MAEAAAALITGGTGALGSVVARAFLAAGYPVAVTYREASEWESLAASEPAALSGARLLGYRTDVTDEDFASLVPQCGRTEASSRSSDS